MSVEVESVKKINALTVQLEEVANQNTKVLEGEQQFQTELSQYLREEDERIRNLNGEFASEVQKLKQEFAKNANEYRQNLHDLRDQWVSKFAFTDKVIPPAPEVSSPSTNHV